MKKEQKRIDKKRKFTGFVTSVSMDSTVKVVTQTPIEHPVYRKVVERRKTFFANSKLDLSVGDKVTIREIKPRSKNVRWEVIDKVD